MQLLSDIHHVTFVSADLDRLIAFYARVFDAPVTLDLTEDGLRHVFIAVGAHTVLHPFQVPGVAPPAGPQPMFARGRLDHFAFNAASEAAFRELHRRLVAEGASDGVVTDMGSLWLLTFTDPDGGVHEVAWRTPGREDGSTLPRAEWTPLALG